MNSVTASIITLKKDETTGELYLDLADILKGTTTRVSTVQYYTLEVREDESISITLFNKTKDV